MISVCLKMKIGGFGNCWLFSKNLFLRSHHTYVDNLRLDYSHLRLYVGRQKGQVVQTDPGELLWVYRSCQIQKQKEKLNFTLKDETIISSHNQYIHFWLKNSNRRHKIYFAHRSYAKKLQRPCIKQKIISSFFIIIVHCILDI